MTSKEAQFPDNLPTGWKRVLTQEKEKPYFQSLTRFLKSRYEAGARIFPARPNILRALQSVDYDDVKVVILGQDPYHGPGQAVGLSFAVPNELWPKPPSLQNIFKEIEADIGARLPEGKSDLTGWASQGVLLLNTVLTVEAGQPLSHRDRGWESFTDRVIELLNAREQPAVFILWGAHAQKKKAMIDGRRHFVIESAHPSPLSAHRGFLGSKCFSRANALLVQKMRREPVDWGRISVN